MRTRLRYLALAALSFAVVMATGVLWDVALYLQDVGAGQGGYARYTVQVQEVWAIAAAVGVLFFLAVDRASNLPRGRSA